MNLRIHQSARAGRESLGPFRTYLLTRGLLLDFDETGAVVTGGIRSSVSYPANQEPDESGLYSPQTYADLLDAVQNSVGVPLVGFVGSPSEDVAFRVEDHAISAGMLGEGLLGRLNELESSIRRRVMDHTGVQEVDLTLARNYVASLENDISYGKLGPANLERTIDTSKNAGVPITEAYFVSNATSIAEDMRHAILAACYHFRHLNRGIQKINQTNPPFSPPTRSEDTPWEHRLMSEEIDELSFAFTSSVVACYTALDLLYVYFVYLTREPFLNPEFPSNLHFPDDLNHIFFRTPVAALVGDRSATDLPYAIANLTAGQFASLRRSRNALVHNMAPDSLRPRVYKGWKQPPVNNQPLQYVQYLSRDIDANGTLVTHPWVRRFYENQADTQSSLLEWLELTWQCAFDTLEWLITRWSNHIKNHT